MTADTELATKIFEYLNQKGAQLGDVSVILIEKALRAHSDKFYEYCGQNRAIVVKASCIGEALGIINDKLNDENCDPTAGIDDLTECQPNPEEYQTNLVAGRGVIALFDMRLTSFNNHDEPSQIETTTSEVIDFFITKSLTKSLKDDGFSRECFYDRYSGAKNVVLFDKRLGKSLSGDVYTAIITKNEIAIEQEYSYGGGASKGLWEFIEGDPKSFLKAYGEFIDAVTKLRYILMDGSTFK